MDTIDVHSFIFFCSTRTDTDDDDDDEDNRTVKEIWKYYGKKKKS